MNPLIIAALVWLSPGSTDDYTQGYVAHQERMEMLPHRIERGCIIGPSLRNVRIGDTFYDVLPTCPDNHDRRL